nr:polysaccharide biosynthesis/export family protein [uncultured Mucilaginibacter sp.]
MHLLSTCEIPDAPCLMSKMFKHYLYYFVAFLLAVSLFSCTSAKKVKYFQDIPDSGSLKTIQKVEFIEPSIQVDDIVTVLVQTIDPIASQIINSGNIATAGTGAIVGVPSYNQQISSGYLVDKNGDIDLPTIGKVKVLGLTILQAKENIRKAVEQLYKVQSVIVRFANFRISITGEVNRPGTYIMPSEKVSILDAIALAGDLTIYGKRDNVLLLRDNVDGTKTPYRINLRKSEVLYAPYFYLRQNDALYVEPSKAKAASTDATQARTFTIIGSVLSVLIVLFTRR